MSFAKSTANPIWNKVPDAIGKSNVNKNIFIRMTHFGLGFFQRFRQLLLSAVLSGLVRSIARTRKATRSTGVRPLSERAA